VTGSSCVLSAAGWLAMLLPPVTASVQFGGVASDD
jgi:hypothetical protein